MICCRLEPGILNTCRVAFLPLASDRPGWVCYGSYKPASRSDSWKSSLPRPSLSFCLYRLSGAAGSLLLAAPAEVPRGQPLLICMHVHRCQQAAARPPPLTLLGWVWVLFFFNAANPQILCRTNTGQLKNDSFFGEKALQTSVVSMWMLSGEGEKTQLILAMSHGDWRFHISVGWLVWGSFTLRYLQYLLYKHLLCAFMHMCVSFPCCS